MADKAYDLGVRDGQRDALRPSWLEWLTETLANVPDGREDQMYVAGYLVGMTDRLAELAEARKQATGPITPRRPYGDEDPYDQLPPWGRPGTAAAYRVSRG